MAGGLEAAVPGPSPRWGPALVNRHSFDHRGYRATSPGRGSGEGREDRLRPGKLGDFNLPPPLKSLESSFPERWMLNY